MSTNEFSNYTPYDRACTTRHSAQLAVRGDEVTCLALKWTTNAGGRIDTLAVRLEGIPAAEQGGLRHQGWLAEAVADALARGGQAWEREVAEVLRARAYGGGLATGGSGWWVVLD